MINSGSNSCGIYSGLGILVLLACGIFFGASNFEQILLDVSKFLVSTDTPMLYYASFFYCWILCGLPVSPPELAIGFLFPYRADIVLLSATTKVVASVVSFFFSLAFFRQWVKTHLVGQNEGMVLVDTMMKTHPWKATVLIRVSAIPTGVQNYGAAAIGCPLHVFTTVSIILAPIYSTVHCLIGSSSTNIVSLLQGTAPEVDRFQSVSLMMGALVLCLLLYLGKTKIRQIVGKRKQSISKKPDILVISSSSNPEEETSHGSILGKCDLSRNNTVVSSSGADLPLYGTLNG